MEADSEVAVAAFLVKQKLQSVLDREVIVDQGLRVKIQAAIDKLKEISDSSEDVDSDDGSLPPIYRAEIIVEEYFLRRIRLKGTLGSFVKASSPISPALWRRRIEIRKALEEVITKTYSPSATSRTSKRENGASPRTHPWENISHYVRMESETISRLQERDTQDLVNRLTQGEQELVVLPVVALGGFGKRELVKRVCAIEHVRNHFKVQARVTVSKDFRYKDFLLNLTEQLTGERLSDRSVDKDQIHVERRIFKSLMDKKYLIVLEDVHGSEDFYKMVSLLPDSKNGSRVVATSQKDVGEDPFNPPFVVKKLTCEESCELLLKQVNERDDGHSKGSSALKEKVMEKCHGVPQAVRLLGGIIPCERGIECWKGVIDEVPESSEREAVTNMVNFSFCRLSTDLKVCLLYLGLFGDSRDIPVRKLLSLWVGEGFFDGSSMGMSPEDEAERCFVELVNRGLIKVTTWKLDGSPKRCRLASNAYNFLYQKSGETFLCEANRQSIGPLNLLRWWADSSGRDLERVSNANNLRSYVSLISGSKSLEAGTIATPNKNIGSVFDTLIRRRGFGLLKVLDLECIYKPVLPERIGRLLLLRFLCLRSSAIDSIPSSVGDLPLLETLDLKHTSVATLPTSVWRSKSLRHLYVNDVRVDGYCQKRNRDSLTNLQTVTGLYIAGERAVANVLDGLDNLRKVALTCHEDSIDAAVRWVLTLPDKLETLKIRCVNGSSKPSTITLSSMTKHKNLRKLYLLGRLQLEMVEEASKEKELRKAKSNKRGKLLEKAESRKEQELRKAASIRTEQLEKAERGRPITAESGRGKERGKLTGSSIAEDVDNSGVGVGRNEDIEKPRGLFALLPNCIRKLTLSMSYLEDDPMQVLGTKFPELIILRIFADSYKGTHMTCSNGWFPKLRCLKLWKLAELKDWKVEQGGMSILQVLEVRMCNNMQNLDGLEHLSGLNKLILTNMPEKFVENVERHSNEGLHIIPTVYDWKSSYHQAETSNQHSPSQGNEELPEKGNSGSRDEAGTSKLGRREPEKEEIISIHDDDAS